METVEVVEIVASNVAMPQGSDHGEGAEIHEGVNEQIENDLPFHCLCFSLVCLIVVLFWSSQELAYWRSAKCKLVRLFASTTSAVFQSDFDMPVGRFEKSITVKCGRGSVPTRWIGSNFLREQIVPVLVK